MNKDTLSSVLHAPAAQVPDELQMVELEDLAHAAPVRPAAAGVLENRLSLFSGVKAQVTAVVGQAQASVGHLLSLKEGELMALDRHVEAPIDLCVDGKVIARGQLCVMGDQFAVRITEVIQAGHNP